MGATLPSSTPKAATDENGDILWKENYAPYGKKLENEAGEQGNHIGYTGKPHERITGFTYLNARYYDPVIGRFMAIDPMEYVDRGALHFQRYAYAYNNPYKYTDPTGEFGVVGAVVGGVFTGISQLAEDGELDFGEIGFDMALGAMGLGLASRAKKYSKLGDDLVDGLVDGLKEAAKDAADPENEVSLGESVVSAAAGKLGRMVDPKVTKELSKVSKTKPTSKASPSACKKAKELNSVNKKAAQVRGDIGGEASGAATETVSKELGDAGVEAIDKEE